ncbi:formylmethanofuran dehydrogenase subunit E family protein [Candidatus Omnitrophota bacterium]
MGQNRISLKKATEFHGHLGPWLVLGILMGERALKLIQAKKYFGVRVKVWGVSKKPRSCLIDGLQLSTGATFGKGNIIKLNGERVKTELLNIKNGKKAVFKLQNKILSELIAVKSHKDSEFLARRLYKTKLSDILLITKD